MKGVRFFNSRVGDERFYVNSLSGGQGDEGGRLTLDVGSIVNNNTNTMY